MEESSLMSVRRTKCWSAMVVTLLAIGGVWGVESSEAQAPGRLWSSRPKDKAVPSVQIYDLSPLVRELQPTVFNLYVEGTNQNPHPYGWPFARRHSFSSRGSGFFIHPKGYALTNFHVVKNATTIRAQLFDKQTFRVKVLGRSPELDIALIQVIHPEGRAFSFAYLGDSSKSDVGSPVIAIGNARGLGLTVTAGIISAKGRELGGQYQAFIQTDAAINRGNSGGPLFNKKGEVIGINTAILRGGRGIGFAVPINIIKRILPQLQSRGFVQRAQLGVSIQAVTPELARSFGLPRPMGALIAEVSPRSPAALGGIRVGDVVIGFDGAEVSNFTDLPRLVAFSPAGAKVRLTLMRQRRKLEVLVRLVKWGTQLVDKDAGGGNFLEPENKNPANPTTPRPRPPAVTNTTSQALQRLGVGVQSVSVAIREQLRLGKTGGVWVSAVRTASPAFLNGLRRGDVIVEINRLPVRSVKHFIQQLSQIPKGENVLLLVRREDSALFLAFPLP